MRRAFLSCVLVCLVGVGELAAQREGSGFWLGGFAGYGVLGLPGCEACDSENVFVGALRLGGRAGDRLLIGAEVSRTGNGAGSALPSLMIATATAYVYPAPRSGLHLKFGAGMAARDAYSNVDGLIGFGIALGAGYDHRIATNLSIVPSVSWFRMPGDYAVSIIHAGVGLTFH